MKRCAQQFKISASLSTEYIGDCPNFHSTQIKLRGETRSTQSPVAGEIDLQSVVGRAKGLILKGPLQSYAVEGIFY